MKSRKLWKTKPTQITKNLTNLKALINTHGIADIDISTLEDNIHNLQNTIPAKIKNIEDADIKQGLYSDRIAKPCPSEIPIISVHRTNAKVCYTLGLASLSTTCGIHKVHRALLVAQTAGLGWC